MEVEAVVCVRGVTIAEPKHVRTRPRCSSKLAVISTLALLLITLAVILSTVLLPTQPPYPSPPSPPPPWQAPPPSPPVPAWVHALCGQTTGEAASGPDELASEYPLLCVDIYTMGHTIVDEPKRMVEMEVSAGGQSLYSGKAGIERRGQTSSGFAKKSYGFETWDADGEDIDVELAGLPEEEDWILNGPYSDKTLLRNVLAFDLVRQMGRYASRTRFCVLTIDAGFKGIYVLMEKVKRDAVRIDIDKNDDEDDPSGGFMLKVDKGDAEERNTAVWTDSGGA